MTVVDLVDELEVALDRGEILAYFQPQVDVDSGRIVAGEALARWKHPVHGILEPDLFIPAAQEHGLLDGITRHIADEVWRCAALWASRGQPVQLALNLSATQLATSAVMGHLDWLLDRYDLPTATVTIEVTETRQLADREGSHRHLTQLRERGLGVSIDDFGAGFSTVERLDALPATELKLDLSLVQDDADAAYEELISIVELAHRRGLRVVAEGVETAEQWRRVQALRCQRAQGYLFGRPVSEKEFGDLLTTRR